jgi:hypothetical protein
MAALAFLHTLQTNVDAFVALVADRRPDLVVRHAVAEDLLQAARSEGLPADLTDRIQAAMRSLGEAAPVVVCTCSTIGGAAEATKTDGLFTAMRIDRPMADRAVHLGPRVRVLAALASTFAPTRALLTDSARRAKRPLYIDERLVTGAWTHFERGDLNGYYEAIATFVRATVSDPAEVDVVVLAQASMAPALDRCGHMPVPILSSPSLGIDAALAALDAYRRA